MAKNRKTPDMNLPVWFDGQNINEALFCEEFLHERRIIFTNGAFFTPDGRVTDDLPLRGEIYDKLKFCAVNNIPRKITNILEVLKLEAQVPDFPPEQDRIHVFNGTLLLNGTFTEGRPAIVRSRLPVVYNPDAPAPVIWLNFLNGLLHAEDIPTLQEFIGYCLIPSNKGQRMMVIKGNGGEGKSQIGAVLSAIFGTNMKDGSIGKISENRFARADLEHILLCVDDVTGQGLKVHKTLEIKGFRGYCQKQAHRRSPFFAPFDSSSDYWFSRCVTRELRFALGVTRELLFLGISEGM